jgi:hypothetical protein
LSDNVFKFNGHEFPVANARLSASLADPVWCDQCNKGAGKALSWSRTKTARNSVFRPSLQPGPFKTNRAKYNAGYMQFTPKAET